MLTPSATLAVRGTRFSVTWGALADLEVRGVDTSRSRAIELKHLDAFESVFPPPWPDRALGGPDDDPLRLPHPILFDLRRQQRINQGGSDFGQDTKTGRGTPGQPPSHG